MGSVTIDEVAAESGTTVEFVRRIAAAGIIQADAEGHFPADAFAVTRAVAELDAAGFDPELVGWAVAEGHLALAFLDEFAIRRSARASQTYGEWLTALGDRGPVVSAVMTALGLPEPGPDNRLGADETELLTEFTDLWLTLAPDRDGPVRGARIAGEGVRRLVEAYLDLWDEIAPPTTTSDGSTMITAPGGELSVRMAMLLPRMMVWLERRHAEASVQARIIRSFEDGLERLGRRPARPRIVPTIGFLDLTGYTRLTEESGDELALQSVVTLQDLSVASATRHGGRVVKLLGDGVMFRFPSASSAVLAMSELLPGLQAAGLPEGHAGLAAGPVIDRDGDVFGRTVNLAARLASHASPNEILVTADIVEAVATTPGSASFESAGTATLKGFSAPVETWRLRPPKRSGDEPS